MKPSQAAQTGALYQIRNAEDLDNVLVDKMSRPLLVGDTVYCAKEIAGAYEYHLVDVLNGETIRLFPGEYFAADAVGVKLDWNEGSQAQSNEALLSYKEVTAKIQGQVAEFLQAMSPELHLERLRHAEPGTVIAGLSPEGLPLFTGACAMLLKNSGGTNPKLTFAVKENGGIVKKRIPLSNLMGARIVDDPGMESFAPNKAEPFVLSFLKPGTILRMEPGFLSEDLFGLPKTVRTSSHAMVQRILKRVNETVLYLSVRKRGGELCEVLVPTWALQSVEVLN